MDMSKEMKTEKAIKILESRLHLVDVKSNGHLRVNGSDFWCTTEKYYNPKTGEKGQGLRNFINLIETIEEK